MLSFAMGIKKLYNEIVVPYKLKILPKVENKFL
jgi:hypothetical protein